MGGGQAPNSKYKCNHCGELIAERHKITMLANGQWVPAKPENVNHDVIGFHLNSLYSPYGWHSWEQIARDFIAAKENPSKLKVFVNTTLGQTWAEKGEAPPYKNLYNRREQYKTNHVPADVCFLTAGVDVQRDRLELEIVGWCADKRSYSIDYRVIEGDTAGTAVWDDLAAVVGERWPRKDGMEFPIRMMAVDTGYNTTHVHTFAAGSSVIASYRSRVRITSAWRFHHPSRWTSPRRVKRSERCASGISACHSSKRSYTPTCGWKRTRTASRRRTIAIFPNMTNTISVALPPRSRLSRWCGGTESCNG